MAVTEDTPSFAIIEGTLCKLNRRGTVVKQRAPLGTAIAEFIVHQSRLFVRENDYGFLLGMPNLYSLDDMLHMLWLAELPSPTDAFAGPLAIDGNILACPSREGKRFRIDLDSGKALDVPAGTAGASAG
ncbi:MAG: hypothetical protein WC378_05445 [Opitutaceae bacterium]